MSVYTSKTMGETILFNSYVGRGVVIGKTADAKKAAIAYFIMGRSENSRNRIFREEGNDVVIYPFDESKVEDPSLIIYSQSELSTTRLSLQTVTRLIQFMILSPTASASQARSEQENSNLTHQTGHLESAECSLWKTAILHTK